MPPNPLFVTDPIASPRAILRERPDSVADVACALGYAEPSAFHRAFLKMSGQTPAAFRDVERRF